MKLPKAVLNISKIFNDNGYQFFLVGGAVRDYLLKGKISDFDFTTDAEPNEVINLFKNVIPVGIEHGTVIVLFENNEFEITTFRSDGKYSDNRHPDKIEYVRNIEEDLKRRDFTINAIAYDISNKKILDLYNGQLDLKNKIIKAIGDPVRRFNEDALRMLRACRFASQLNFKIDEATLNAVKTLNKKIKNISSERIHDELIKIMYTEKPSISLEYMRKTGLMDFILPELKSCYGIIQNKFHKYDVYYHNVYSCDAAPRDNYIIRFAALFHDIAKPQTQREKEDDQNENSFYNHEIIGSRIAKNILRRLKFSNHDIKSITHLIKHHMFYYTSEWTDGAVRRFIRNVELENLDDLFTLRQADRVGNGMKQGVPEIFIEFKKRIAKILEIDNAFKVTDLNINGNQIIESLNLKPGPIIGEILNYLLELVLDTPELNNYDKLLDNAKLYYNNKKDYSNKNYGKNPEDLGNF